MYFQRRKSPGPYSALFISANNAQPPQSTASRVHLSPRRCTVAFQHRFESEPSWELTSRKLLAAAAAAAAATCAACLHSTLDTSVNTSRHVGPSLLSPVDTQANTCRVVRVVPCWLVCPRDSTLSAASTWLEGEPKRQLHTLTLTSYNRHIIVLLQSNIIVT